MRCAGTTAALPRLGTACTHESTRKLARRLEAGTARILSATVSRTAQRWFVSFTVEVERAIPQHHARPHSAVGTGLGVRTLLTAVDGDGIVLEVPGPKPLRAGLRKLRRLSRAHSRKAKGSANRRKANANPSRVAPRLPATNASSSSTSVHRSISSS
jgi:putative transposase